MEDLPVPTSGLQAEIAFRRQLRACESIIGGDSVSRPDMTQWQSSPVFHKYVEALQDALSDLETEGAKRLPQSTLRNYRNSVDRVSRQLLPVKTSLLVQALSRSAAAALERSSGSPHAPRETASTSAHQQQEQPAQQLRQRGMPALGPPSSKTAGHLQRHSDLQEQLTDELVALAAGLKRNTQAMQAVVEQRGQLLDETDQALETNVISAKRSAKEAGIAHRKSKRSFWFTLLVLLCMGGVFTGMYAFIRVTSFVGYRAPRAVPR